MQMIRATAGSHCHAPVLDSSIGIQYAGPDGQRSGFTLRVRPRVPQVIGHGTQQANLKPQDSRSNLQRTSSLHVTFLVLNLVP